jgi:hypothetical protein
VLQGHPAKKAQNKIGSFCFQKKKIQSLDWQGRALLDVELNECKSVSLVNVVEEEWNRRMRDALNNVVLGSERGGDLLIFICLCKLKLVAALNKGL